MSSVLKKADNLISLSLTEKFVHETNANLAAK